jgi:hypothetical protein
MEEIPYLGTSVSVSSSRIIDEINSIKYEGHLKSSWTGGSALLLCRGRRFLLCQVVVVGVM